MVLAKRVVTSKTPSHLWIDRASKTIFCTMQDSDELVAIDLNTQTIKWRTKTGAMPVDVFGTPDSKFILVGLTGGDGVEVYDVSGPLPQKLQLIKTGKVPTPSGPWVTSAMCWSATGWPIRSARLTFRP